MKDEKRWGIILSGGFGTRIGKATACNNKHLIRLYDKLVIDYSLQVLIDNGCENICCVAGGSFFQNVMLYLRDGQDYGVNINYVMQHEPSGISQAINLCKSVIRDNSFITILGDNFFENSPKYSGSGEAQITLSKHDRLSDFGVAEIDKNNNIAKIVEKPKVLNCNYTNLAITGCYYFDEKFFDFFKKTKRSARNEYEITDILNLYLKEDNLTYNLCEGLWSDMGSISSLVKLEEFLRNKNA